MKIKQMEFQFKDGSSIYLDEDKAKELYLKLKELFRNTVDDKWDFPYRIPPVWVTTFSDNPDYANPYTIESRGLG